MTFSTLTHLWVGSIWLEIYYPTGYYPHFNNCLCTLLWKQNRKSKQSVCTIISIRLFQLEILFLIAGRVGFCMIFKEKKNCFQKFRLFSLNTTTRRDGRFLRYDLMRNRISIWNSLSFKNPFVFNSSLNFRYKSQLKYRSPHNPGN